LRYHELGWNALRTDKFSRDTGIWRSPERATLRLTVVISLPDASGPQPFQDTVSAEAAATLLKRLAPVDAGRVIHDPNLNVNGTNAALGERRRQLGEHVSG